MSGLLTDNGKVEAALAFKNYDLDLAPSPPEYWFAIGRITPWGYCNIVASATISAHVAAGDDYFLDTVITSDLKNLKIGDTITTTGFVNALNNGVFIISNVVITTEIRIYVTGTLANEAAGGSVNVVGTSSELNPPSETFDTEELDEIIGYVKVTNLSLAYEDIAGVIVYRTRTFTQLVLDSDAHTYNAHFVYLNEDIPYADELPTISFRQIGLYRNVTPTASYLGREWLVPYGLAKGSIQQPFTIIASNNDTISIEIDGSGPFLITIAPGTYSASELVILINAQINSLGGGLAYAYEGDGVIYIRSYSTSPTSSIELFPVANSMYDTLGMTVGLYENEVSDSGLLVYYSNETVHTRHLSVKDDLELIIEF